jgi:hypothetical protein
MDCTDYIIAIVQGNPSVVTIDLQAGATVDVTRLPAGLTVDPWAEDWSEGLDANGTLVVRFRA